MIKFKAKSIGRLKKPLMIVGMCPGRQRKNEQTQIVWEGNQSADFLNSIIYKRNNIYLTNVFNEYTEKDVSEKMIQEGLYKLEKDISRLKPRAIICLGRFALMNVTDILEKLNVDIQLIKIQHPSFILRFKKDKKKYRENFLKAMRCLYHE